jgi:hypothetical protein
MTCCGSVYPFSVETRLAASLSRRGWPHPSPRVETRQASSLRQIAIATSAAAPLFLQPLQKTWHMHNRASDRSAPDLLKAVVGRNAHDIETSVKRFELGPSVNPHSDPTRRPVFNVNRDAHRNLSLVAKGLQRAKTRCFHQTDHVRRRIHRRQRGIMRRQRVLAFHYFCRFGTCTNRNRSSQCAHLQNTSTALPSRFLLGGAKNRRDSKPCPHDAQIIVGAALQSIPPGLVTIE